MKKLKISFWLQKHRNLLIWLGFAAVICVGMWGVCTVDISALTKNEGLFGVVGTLLGAFIGGVFSLLGSFWVNNKQQKAVQNIKRKNVIYSPLYDELVDIHNNILEQNPFPCYVKFQKALQTALPHPQYDAWRRIKSDTRFLEVPDYLKKQMEKLESAIKNYIECRDKVNDEIRNIFNDTLDENGLEKSKMVDIGRILSCNILENKIFDVYLEATMNDNNEISQEKKNKVNEEVLNRCNENLLIFETRKKYEEWLKVQNQTIEMLSIMIKKILLKYEA